MRQRRMSRVLRLCGVDMGFEVYEHDKERVTESSESNSRLGADCASPARLATVSIFSLDLHDSGCHGFFSRIFSTADLGGREGKPFRRTAKMPASQPRPRTKTRPGGR